jgi:hypothetical protein
MRRAASWTRSPHRNSRSEIRGASGGREFQPPVSGRRPLRSTVFISAGDFIKELERLVLTFEQFSVTRRSSVVHVPDGPPGICLPSSPSTEIRRCLPRTWGSRESSPAHGWCSHRFSRVRLSSRGRLFSNQTDRRSSQLRGELETKRAMALALGPILRRYRLLETPARVRSRSR